jgi:hypothetical protein
MTQLPTRTRYSIKTGLLHSLAIDWTGRGPASRSWRWRGFNDCRNHLIGQVLGFVLMLALIISMAALTVTGNASLGVTVAGLIVSCNLGANFIAARLP